MTGSVSAVYGKQPERNKDLGNLRQEKSVKWLKKNTATTHQTPIATALQQKKLIVRGFWGTLSGYCTGTASGFTSDLAQNQWNHWA